MSSFEAKMVQEWSRNREKKKNYRSDQFLLELKQRMKKKIAKKFKKFKTS